MSTNILQDPILFALLCGVVASSLTLLYLRSSKPAFVKGVDGEIDKSYVSLVSLTVGVAVTILVFLPKCSGIVEPISSSVY